jgi:hypothetical protein
MHDNSLKNLQKFQPGQTGNPQGRPARARLTEKFIADVADSWQQHGAKILEGMIKRQPDRFADLCSRLIPRDVQLSLEARAPVGLDAEALEILQAIKQSLPDANTRAPGEVLNFVLSAVRAHSAPTIEGHTENPLNTAEEKPA